MSDHDHQDDGHHGPEHQAHHFKTMDQQLEANKLGMWAFLATEILMFGGLFCAYAIYRATNKDVFLFAHQYLDTKWGAINTVVLLTSSLTMAWGVRAAQLGQRTTLNVMLALTLLGGFGFMGIKTIEYHAKWKHDLFVGDGKAEILGFEFEWRGNAFKTEQAVLTNPEAANHTLEYLAGKKHGEGHGDAHAGGHGDEHDDEHGDEHGGGVHLAEDVLLDDPAGHGGGEDHGDEAPNPGGHGSDSPAMLAQQAPSALNRSNIQPPHAAVQGLTAAYAEPGDGDLTHEGHHYPEYVEMPVLDKQRTYQFFNIYFVMTGLHGLHVLIGMALIAWLLFMSMAKKSWGSQRYAPVDIIGLYWHLVDLIWIFLFPLLYLIH